MKSVMVGFVAKRNEDGSFGEQRPIMREVADNQIGESGQPKVLEQKLNEVAERVFAPLFAEHQKKGV